MRPLWRLNRLGTLGRPLEGLARGRAPGACAAAIALGALGFAGCGGTPGSAVIARVGDRAITKGEVDRWAGAIERGGAFAGFRGRPRGSAKRRALVLLISSYWLMGEARRRGLPISGSALDAALAEREREARAPGGRLRTKGLTRADLELEARAEIAAEELRETLAEQANEVTPRQVREFYSRHRALFASPRARVTDLIENLPSRAAASALVRRIGTGRRFAERAYHERVTRTPGFMGTRQKARVVDAIFSAPVGAAGPAVRLNGGWAVFVVRAVVPARGLPFAKVRGEVLARARVARQRRLKAAFDREFTAYWRSRTSCEPAYRAPGCRGWRGVLGAYEDPFSSRAHPLLSEAGVGG